VHRQSGVLQALKGNPDGAPKELKISANRLTRFGQIALQEALDMVRAQQTGPFSAGSMCTEPHACLSS
jgi:hypothetical protein